MDGAVTDVDFNVDATLRALGSDDHSARIYDVTAGIEVARVSRPFGVTAVTFAPDGRLAVGDDGNTVEFWSPPSKG